MGRQVGRAVPGLRLDKDSIAGPLLDGIAFELEALEYSLREAGVL